jgi:hypothetical protein
MYTLHRFLGVSNLEHALVDLTCVRKEREINQTETGQEKEH